MTTTQSPAAATVRRAPALMTATRKSGKKPEVLTSTKSVAQPKVSKLAKTPGQKIRESRVQNNASGQSLPDARLVAEAAMDEIAVAAWNNGTPSHESEMATVAQPPAPEATPSAYVGPMLALRERSKLGLYTIAPNGQPSCGDEIARQLGTLRPEFVIRACIIAMALPFNPYDHLNVGQQSMNLRNRLRTAIKRGDFGMGVIIEAVEEAQAEQDIATH